MRRLRSAVKSRLLRVLGVGAPQVPQLELALPSTVREVSVPTVPAEYALRTYRAGDDRALIELFNACGFGFDEPTLRRALSICLPRGCFVIEHRSSGALVSCMMARHLSALAHPFGGRIDWLATDPVHRKRGLADLCARSATRRLIEAGYDHIWVTTDDERIGALRIFLDIGFEPVCDAQSADRWKSILSALDRSPALLFKEK